MFDEFKEVLQKYSKDTSKIFENVAKKGAIRFVKEAKNLTDNEGVVDTGFYKRNWYADATIVGDVNIVYCENSVDYSLYIEEGYVLKKNQFIPFEKMEGTPKTKALISRIKAKYPNAKGFTRKAGRYKGKFIGRRATDEAYVYCIDLLQKEIDKLLK